MGTTFNDPNHDGMIIIIALIMIMFQYLSLFKIFHTKLKSFKIIYFNLLLLIKVHNHYSLRPTRFAIF